MEQKKELQITLSPEVANGTYSNLAIIGHTSSEFIIDFVRLMPGVPKAGVQSRVIMTPEHAKRLLNALRENISGYERQFGEIEIKDKNMNPNQLPPLSFDGGMA